MEANIQAKAVSLFREAIKRHRNAQIAVEQAVSALIDRNPRLSRSIARRHLARLLMHEEGFNPRLCGDTAADPK